VKEGFLNAQSTAYLQQGAFGTQQSAFGAQQSLTGSLATTGFASSLTAVWVKSFLQHE
jgi:hypothetical protein